METGPNFGFKKIVGSGMIRFVWSSSAWAAVAWGSLRLGNDTVAPVDPGKPASTSVICRALPALSCQVWKCAVSVGPMLRRMRRTSTLLTRCARAG